MIVQQGQLNLTAQLVPNLIIQIVPPTWTLINGLPTNIVGIVGTATWGPVNSPATASGTSDATRQFGPLQARKYDLGTAVAVAALQGGAAALKLVRVTDGTDTAASAALAQAAPSAAAKVSGGTGYAANDTVTLGNGTVITVNTVSSGVITTFTLTTPGSWPSVPANPVAQASTSGTGTGATFNLTFPAGLTLTAYYTGTLGNSLSALIGAGSNSTSGAPTYKLTVQLPGQTPEVFDNIGGTGNALYVAMAAAVNGGQSGLRGPSQIIVATAGSATGAPMTGTIAATGGTDGTATITSAVMIGVDTNPRSGMYALRQTGASVAMLTDLDDSTTWTTQVAFGLSEGVYMIATSSAGDSLSGFQTKVTSAGIDSYAIKIMFGDWCYINDPVTGVQRLISPQGFIAGLLGNMTPSSSSLNKPLQGIVATQKTFATQQYSQADLQQIALARGDLITNPAPGGSYYAARFGRNTSSNAVINGDNYTRMTNYLATSLNAGMGIYIGRKISPSTMRQAKATIVGFLTNVQNPPGGGDGDIQAFQVTLDATNNPITQTALGIMSAYCKVQYFSILTEFVISLEAGQSVIIIKQSTPAF